MKKEFRVFHILEKKYGIPVPNPKDDPYNPIDFEFEGGLTNLEYALQDTDHYIVEQWTGLLDEKEVKIFEGDRVKYIDWDDSREVENYPPTKYGIVFFSIYGAGWVVRRTNEKFESLYEVETCGDPPLWHIHATDIEVIELNGK